MVGAFALRNGSREGGDSGTQYRSVVFTHEEEQGRVAREMLLVAAGWWETKIVTEIEPLARFYPAEVYHQDYYKRNPTQPYCLGVVAPKVAKVRAKFADRIRR